MPGGSLVKRERLQREAAEKMLKDMHGQVVKLSDEIMPHLFQLHKLVKDVEEGEEELNFIQNDQQRDFSQLKNQVVLVVATEI